MKDRSTAQFLSKLTVEIPCSQKYMATKLQNELVSAGIHLIAALVAFSFRYSVFGFLLVFSKKKIIRKQKELTCTLSNLKEVIKLQEQKLRKA